jgi:hypothetical protein
LKPSTKVVQPNHLKALVSLLLMVLMKDAQVMLHKDALMVSVVQRVNAQSSRVASMLPNHTDAQLVNALKLLVHAQ